jgi:hypothetical protein
LRGLAADAILGLRRPLLMAKAPDQRSLDERDDLGRLAALEVESMASNSRA